MRILSLDIEPFCEIPFLNAGKGAGQYTVDSLPVQIGRVDRLPDDLDALIATADLQGRELFEEAVTPTPRLVGEVLPPRLCDQILPDLCHDERLRSLDPARVGVVLAGDFYTVPALDKRGGSGDVTPVWSAFGERFKWVVGVAGNHDTFGEAQQTQPRFSRPLYFLEQRRVQLGNWQIAGLGGIIGNPKRPQRRFEDAYLRALTQLLGSQTDLLICHDGPDAPAERQRGSAEVRKLLEQRRPRLVIRGHAHWSHPFCQLAGGVQILNVDARVVILLPNNPA